MSSIVEREREANLVVHMLLGIHQHTIHKKRNRYQME
jgi:hypothetical protein